MAPFGFGNPEPLFCLSGAEIAAPSGTLGERGHLIPMRQGGRTVKTWNFCRARRGTRARHSRGCGDFVQNDDYSRKRGYPGWCVLLKDLRTAARSVGR